MKRWIVVVDSQRFRVLEVVAATIKKVIPTLHPQDIEQISHKDKGVSLPGRAMGTTHVYEPHSDWTLLKKRKFARTVAVWINESHKAFDSLILIASPHILGEIRKLLTSKVLEKVEVELAKDLSKFSAENIIQHINVEKFCFPILPNYEGIEEKL